MKIFPIILTLFLIFLAGCSSNFNQNNINQEKKISINNYFNSTIENYNYTITNITKKCLSGDCSYYTDYTKYPFSKIESCYFCDLNILTNNKIDLLSTKSGSGSINRDFGCRQEVSGDEINGLDIIYQDDSLIIAKGISTHEFSQNSSICDKVNDPECDDMTYGTCSGPDYKMEFVKEIEFIIEKK